MGDRDEVLAGVSLAEVMTRVVGPARHRRWPCPSPTHAQTGRTPPVSLDEEKGLWCCHGCEAGGTAIDVLVLGAGLSVAEAFAELSPPGGRDGRRPRALGSRVSRRARRLPSHDPPAGGDTAPGALQALRTSPRGSSGRREGPTLEPSVAARHLARFCVRRAWDPGVVTALGLEVVLDAWGNPRVRFGSVLAGEVVWHQDRAIYPGVEPRWLGARGRRVPFLAGGGLSRAAGLGAILLVEGPSDAVAVAHAFPRCPTMALPGASFDARWAPALAGLAVVVLTDADPAGDRLRAQLDEVTDRPVTHVHVPAPAGDVDDWRREDPAGFGARLSAVIGDPRLAPGTGKGTGGTVTEIGDGTGNTPSDLGGTVGTVGTVKRRGGEEGTLGRHRLGDGDDHG